MRGNGNLTVAFFPTGTSEEAYCEANDPTNAISLTTDTVPTHFVCFNLTDLFTQANNTGTQNGSKWSSGDVYQGVNYTLHNQRSYNLAANYTNVWYRQRKLVWADPDDSKPGKEADWVLYMYAFEDCYHSNGDLDYDEWPWYETSCLTEQSGECRQVLKPIKSFAIGPAADYNRGHGGCEVWARLGDGPSMWNRQTATLLVITALMATFLVL